MNDTGIENEIENLDDPISLNNNTQHDYSNTLGVSAGIDPDFVSGLNLNKKENIGLLPPDKDPKIKKTGIIKRVIFIVVLLLSIAFVGYGVYYYLSMANSKAKIRVIPKDIFVNAGDTLSMNPLDYATFNGISASNCYVDLSGIDVDTIGKYTYYIKCGNEVYDGVLEIKDSTSPVVKSMPIIKTVGSSVTAEEFIADCIDATQCEYELVDSTKVLSYLNAAGEYSVDIKVKDQSGNETAVQEKLTVIDKKIAYYLTCQSQTTIDEGIKYSLYGIDKFAFDESNQFMSIASRTSYYLYFSSTAYNEDKEASKDGFKGFTSGVSFDDTKYEVVVETNLTSDTLNNEYGNTFPKDYVTVVNYYIQKGYTCTQK